MELRAGLLACLLSTMACGDKAASRAEEDDTAARSLGGSSPGDTGGSAGTGAGSGSGTGGIPSSEQPPTMNAADAHCYQHETGEARWIWVVSGTADDPQGIDTLERVVPEGVVVEFDGAERARLDLACDTAGSCSGSYSESETGVLCSDATRTVFFVTALDEDGNRSAPAAAEGRQQPSARPRDDAR